MNVIKNHDTQNFKVDKRVFLLRREPNSRLYLLVIAVLVHLFLVYYIINNPHEYGIKSSIYFR
jgi:hypothetical protein